MISIVDKQKCCGCSACAQSCPKHCIKMVTDREGFLYPVVDTVSCISCNYCEKVCPFLNESEACNPIIIQVAYNPDEKIRLDSSSGGLFSLFAEYIINKGGVVFGARFDSRWDVIHDYTDNLANIAAFRGSKYVQSRIGDSFNCVKLFLEDGNQVLFSGTPCQVFALKNYLGKEYNNLYTIDIVCHGVSSPLVWKDYLSFINPGKEEIDSINMRDKTRGWSHYSYKIKTKNTFLFDDFAAKSIFLQTFISGYSLRPSCFNCPVKGGKSQSDITLADAWGINKVYPEMNDEKGLNVVCVNSKAGQDLYNSITKVSKPFPLGVFYSENPSFHSSTKEPDFREKYWTLYLNKKIKAYYSIKRMTTPPIYKSVIQKIIRLFK